MRWALAMSLIAAVVVASGGPVGATPSTVAGAASGSYNTSETHYGDSAGLSLTVVLAGAGAAATYECEWATYLFNPLTCAATGPTVGLPASLAIDLHASSPQVTAVPGDYPFVDTTPIDEANHQFVPGTLQVTGTAEAPLAGRRFACTLPGLTDIAYYNGSGVVLSTMTVAGACTLGV